MFCGYSFVALAGRDRSDDSVSNTYFKYSSAFRGVPDYKRYYSFVVCLPPIKYPLGKGNFGEYEGKFLKGLFYGVPTDRQASDLGKSILPLGIPSNAKKKL